MTAKTQTQPDIQYRNFSTTDMLIETRTDEPPVIEGHAAVFDKFSEPFFGFIEKVAPGAFARAIREKQDVRALVDHLPSSILGRTKSGTLTLREDSRGLRVRIQPPGTTLGRDTTESIRRGDIDQMSFGFMVKKESLEREAGPNGEDVRIIEDVDLFDVSVVTFPAYPDTDVGVRQFRSWAESMKETNLDRARELVKNMNHN